MAICGVRDHARVSIERLLEEIDRLSAFQACVTVAIDGHSAAGKSTIGNVIEHRRSAAVVHGDDFYSVMDPEERAAFTASEGADRYYDWQRMRSVALEPLLTGSDAVFHPYDWDTNQLSDREKRIAASNVVVVEGLFVSRRELADVIDLAVFVDVHQSIRERRQAERDDASQDWLDRWDGAERHFFETVRQPETFDVRIAGTSSGAS